MVQFTKDPARDNTDDLSGHTHRQLLGYIGLLLPLLLVVMVFARDGMTRWESLYSISAYYYTGAVAAFAGMLVSMALFLFTYRGYDNKYNWADRWAGIIAAVAALGVAVFPTRAPTGVPRLSWWEPWHGVAHYIATVVLFAMFALFALWLFRLRGSQASPGKNWRNRVYLACGLVIVASMICAGFFADGAIFWQESTAMVAFAVSWLVKGKADRTIRDTGRSLIGRVKSMFGRKGTPPAQTPVLSQPVPEAPGE